MVFAILTKGTVLTQMKRWFLSEEAVQWWPSDKAGEPAVHAGQQTAPEAQPPGRS